MHHLQEKIQTAALEALRADCHTFLSNIGSLDTLEKFQELNLAWFRFVRNTLVIRLGKQVLGIDTLNAVTGQPVKDYESFISWCWGAFLPTATDIGAYNRDTESEVSLGVSANLAASAKFWTEVNPSENRRGWSQAYDVFKETEGKREQLAKKIDAFFDKLIKAFPGPIDQKVIEENLMIDGCHVKLEYAEKNAEAWGQQGRNFGRRAGPESDFIAGAVSDFKRATQYIRDANFGIALKHSDFTFSTVDKKARDANKKADATGKMQSWGTGGFYSLNTRGITLLEGRLIVYDSWAVIDAIVHETGHKFYYECLQEPQRKEWIKFYDKVKDSEYDEYSMSKLYDGIHSMGEKMLIQKGKLDQVNLRLGRDKQYGTHEVNQNSSEYRKFSDPEFFSKLTKKTMPHDLQRFLEEQLDVSISDFVDDTFSRLGHSVKSAYLKETGLVRPIAITKYSAMAQTVLKDLLDGRTKNMTGFPSEYGSTNASEFFAEVFAGYCLWKTDHGRKAFSLIEPVFAKFIDVTRVRSGLHESISSGRRMSVAVSPTMLRESIPGFSCVPRPFGWQWSDDGWKSGVLTVERPLYVESVQGWPARLSEKFGGKTGMALNVHLRKLGYDSILVETKSGDISKVVALDRRVVVTLLDNR